MFLRAIQAALILLAISTTALAQHEGDVEFAYESGKIIIEGGSTSYLFADQYFEGAFATSGLFNGISEDPGFESHMAIGAGDLISFNLHTGHNGWFLHYFDPVIGALSSTTNDLTINWGVGSLSLSNSSGGSGIIGQADPTGLLHTHVDFEISNKGSSNYGAYGFLMSLESDDPLITDSDPFWVFLNYGMDDISFDSAIGNITAVPEPGSLALVSLAVAGLFQRRSRKV